MKQFFLFFMIVLFATAAFAQQKIQQTLGGFSATQVAKLQPGQSIKGGVCYLDRPQRNVSLTLSGTYIILVDDNGKSVKQPIPGEMFVTRPADWDAEFFDLPMDEKGYYLTPKPIACVLEKTKSGYVLALIF